MIIIKIAGIVDISNQIQPHIHSMNAIIDRIGDSHSKQLLHDIQPPSKQESERERKRKMPNKMSIKIKKFNYVINFHFSGLFIWLRFCQYSLNKSGSDQERETERENKVNKHKLRIHRVDELN